MPFNNEITKLTTKTRNHASVFNEVNDKLLENTKYNKEQHESLKNEMDATKHTHSNKNVLDTITSERVNSWNTVSNKVDKVSDKGLSTNDYTTEEKNKLAGVETNANKYVHPNTTGHKHVPSGGSDGQILRWASDGTARWDDENTGGGGEPLDLPVTIETNANNLPNGMYRGTNLTNAPIAGEVIYYTRYNDVNRTNALQYAWSNTKAKWYVRHSKTVGKWLSWKEVSLADHIHLTTDIYTDDNEVLSDILDRMNNAHGYVNSKKMEDFNACVKNGKYTVYFNGNGVEQHAPSNIIAGENTFTVDVTQESDNLLTQEICGIYGHSQDRKFYRVNSFGTWSKWKELATTDSSLSVKPADVFGRDFNNANINGMYHIVDAKDWKNKPPTSESVGNMIVMSGTTNNSLSKIQYFIPFNGSGIYIRTRGYGLAEWTTWREIATTDKTDISPLNGWVVYGGFYNTKLTVSKSGNIVSIDAFIKNGIKTTGTTLFTIPQQYRPEFIKYHSCNVYPIQNGQQAVVEIGPSGDVSLSYIPPGATSLGIYVQYSV